QHDVGGLAALRGDHHDEPPLPGPEQGPVVAARGEVGGYEGRDGALARLAARDDPGLKQGSRRRAVAARELVEGAELATVQPEGEQGLEERPPARPACALEIAERRRQLDDRALERLYLAPGGPHGGCLRVAATPTHLACAL